MSGGAGPGGAVRRRAFLQLSALGGAAVATPFWAGGCGGEVRLTGAAAPAPAAIDPRSSAFGRWVEREGLPAFVYEADHETLPAAEWSPITSPNTRRQWLMVGNRAIKLQAANDGTVAIFDESYGLRWLVAPDPEGTGVSVLNDEAGKVWGSAYKERAGGATPPQRTFGPTWFRVRDEHAGLALERTILCPEGEVPWVLVRVRLELAKGAAGPRDVRHVERWRLCPRFLNLLESAEQRKRYAELAVTYDVSDSVRGLVAAERFADPAAPGEAGQAARLAIGPPAVLALERLGATEGSAAWRDEGVFSTLEIETPVSLSPGDVRELWFRFGRRDESEIIDPEGLFAQSMAALAARLPTADAPKAPEARQEVPWHAAILTGGASVDRVAGGHSLDQASAYSYVMGFNGAARDPLQHALPLVYTEPDLALSVLRNTCAWATPEGDLPYALVGPKAPTNLVFRPSDQNLWALWLAAEYAAATGDLGAFDEPLSYHPSYGAPPAPLREHLRRQFRFFVDVIGRGEGGHVRILNADWNDVAISESGVDAGVMIERGGSVLNSAMASWVLGVFAGLAERLGEAGLAAESRQQAEDLRLLVASAFNGRWFHRAYAPSAPPVGENDCWLEVQPWAILCGAADAEQARALLEVIDRGHRAGSPAGARLRWPLPSDGGAGEGTHGGIWFSINMTLIWAAARTMPDLAWSEWRRMSLGAHTAAYADIWEGTLSGPDCWNAPESARPGRTWASPTFGSMQAFPVNNMHCHAQPLLSYLRLLGVEPTADGSLAIGGGGSFASRSFRLGPDGRGSLDARGPVVLETSLGAVRAGPGAVRW